jgi:SPP1 family predicted phage head-tail adaptor
MPSIGGLDRRVTVQKYSLGRDQWNNPIEVWTDLATVWAARTDVSDSEKLTGGQVLATLVSRFVVRSTAAMRTVKPTDRLASDGAVWEITGIKETRDGRNRFLEISTARAV